VRVLYLSRADEFRDKSSLVIIAKSVLKYMQKADPEMFVTWVIPAGTKQEVLDEYVLAEMPDPSRVEFLPVMAGLSGRTLGYFMTQDLWYAATQTKVRTPYDVVLTNQMAMVPVWATVLTNRYMSSRYAVKTPLVCWQMWTATTRQLREVPEYYAGEADVVAESLSSMFCRSIWESEVLKQSHLETIRAYVKPHVVQRVLDQSDVVANGVDWPNLTRVYEKRQRRQQSKDGPRLFWGGRLANQKRPRVTFPLMAKTQAIARCPVVVSTNRPESDPDVAWCRETFPDWALHTGIDRTGFFGLMGEGDVFLCNSLSESYGVAWLEMLATGMLGVFERAWWNETLLPKWYPFVADSEDEQVRMALVLLKQWPDGDLWRKYADRVGKWVAQEHSEERAGVRIAEILREEKQKALVEDASKGTGSVGELAQESADALWRGEPLEEEAIWREMSSRSSSDREWGKPGDVVSRMYLRRCLEAGPWRDLCRSAKVEFVKEGWRP
jgi:hypothetical protein